MLTTHRSLTRLRWLALYLAVVAALVLGSLSPAQADGNDTAPVDDEAFDVDTAAALDEVPREEAERFSLLQDSYWRFVAAAEGVSGFAGVWVSWDPLTVHHAGTAGAPSSDLVAILGEPSLITHHDVEHDLVQLEAAQQELIDLRADGSIPSVDLDIDIRENELVLYSPDSAIFSRVQGLADIEVPLRWEQAPLAIATTSGGGSMGNGCTAGFMVRRLDNATVFGPLSAGHTGCRNATTYVGLSTSVPSWQASGNRDSSVHDLAGGTNQNLITIGVSPYYRTITGRLGWSTGLVGQSVCKQGRTTGYGCTTVNSVYFSPSYIPSSTRFLYMNSGTLCNNGDSGGPWFQSNNAVGLTSGKIYIGSPSNAGRCIVGSITYQIPSGWMLTTT